jgi:O-antigen ligase
VGAATKVQSARVTRSPQNAVVAVALGVTAASVIRGGAFYTPDLVAVPIVVAIVAAVTIRRVTRADALLGLALIGFAVVWQVRGFQAHTAGRAASLTDAAVAFGATYLLARHTSSDNERLLVTRVLVFVGAGVAFVSLIGWTSHRAPWGLPFDGVWRLSGPFAYPNAAGLFFALAFIANVAQNERAWTERAVAGALLIGALVATASRGAFLALGVGLVITGGRALTDATLGRRRLVAIASCVAALATVYVALLTFGLVGNAGAHSSTASLDDRVAEWSAAARQGADKPLVGRGPDQDLYIHNFRGDAVARYAHNEPLQVFAGAGLIGVAALALVFAAAVGAIRDAASPRGRLAPAALAVVFVGGLVDFNWHFVGLMAFAGWLVGLNEDSPSPATE